MRYRGGGCDSFLCQEVGLRNSFLPSAGGKTRNRSQNACGRKMNLWNNADANCASIFQKQMITISITCTILKMICKENAIKPIRILNPPNINNRLPTLGFPKNRRQRLLIFGCCSHFGVVRKSAKGLLIFGGGLYLIVPRMLKKKGFSGCAW